MSTFPSPICACIRSTSSPLPLIKRPKNLFKTKDKKRRWIFAGSDIEGNDGRERDHGKLRKVGKENMSDGAAKNGSLEGMPGQMGYCLHWKRCYSERPQIV